MRVDREDQG